MESKLHLRLKEGTQEAHTDLERVLDLSSSLAAYVRYLRCMLSFHAPLEDALQRSVAFQSFLPDAQLRVRVPALRADLAALDVSPTLQPTPELPELHTLPQVVGVSYVLEGSTLGGQVIARMLREAFNLSDHALHYVLGYGDHTGRRFKVFLERLEQLTFDENETDSAVTSAHQTFILLKRALMASGPALHALPLAPEPLRVH